MSENVSMQSFKIWADSQEKVLNTIQESNKNIFAGQEKINSNIQQVIELLRDETSTNKAILKQHIFEYNTDKKSIDVRFKNLFKRQDKIDSILLERAPAFFIYKGVSKGVKIFISAMIVLLAGYYAVMWGIA